MSDGRPLLSAVVVVHNEEAQLAECLKGLSFCDEIVVVLDRCTDKSKEIAQLFASNLVEGAWEREGPRRHAGIDACNGTWVLEVDADERVSPALADEIRRTCTFSTVSWHQIPVDNYIGDRLVRYGWGASFGKGAFAGLYRYGAKRWGDQRVHPEITLSGSQGPTLKGRLVHYVDRNISDMIRRLDRYTTARARDMRESGRIGSYGPTCGASSAGSGNAMSRGAAIARGRTDFSSRFAPDFTRSCPTSRRGWKRSNGERRDGR